MLASPYILPYNPYIKNKLSTLHENYCPERDIGQGGPRGIKKEEQLKKTILAVLFVLLWCALPIWAAELKVGDTVPNFSLKDSLGKVYTLDSDDFKARVVYILYTDPDEKNLNSHVEDALLKD